MTPDLAPPIEFVASTRAVAAPGLAAERLAIEAGALARGTWAAVADRGFAEAGGLDQLLSPMASRVAVVGLVGEDPGLDDVERLTEAALAAGADGVIAVGGGSGLCAGKAVAIRLTNPPPLSDYAGTDRLASAPAPCVAVPTTGGSGSEVSEVVILHRADTEPHLMIRGRGYAPDVAILDGELLASLPERPLVLAALDAYSHVCEALWSRRAGPFTDALAAAAGERIRAALPRAMDADPSARQALVEAAAMANYACGNAELAMVHAIASTPSVHLPHGYQTGVLLPHVARWCAPALRPIAAREAAEIEPFYRTIGFEPRFAPGELGDAELEAMAASAASHPLLANDPRGAGPEDVRGVLRDAGVGTSVVAATSADRF